jgi:peptidoglycan lytic transglycosylase
VIVCVIIEYMLFKPSGLLKTAAITLIVFSGFLAACAPQRPLIVPTTPPSERKQNPGLQDPSENKKEPSDAIKEDKPAALGPDCPAPADCFNMAVLEAKDGHQVQADGLLQKVRHQYPDTLWARRAEFLAGRWAADRGSPEADELLSRAITDLPILEEYSLFSMAGGQFRRGDSQRAVETYNNLVKKFPDSVLIPEANFQMASALSQAGDCQAAVASWNDFVARYPKDPEASQALLLLADCALKLKDPNRAVSALQQVWFVFPDSPEADEAQSKLQGLAASGISVPEPSGDLRYQRGRTLFDVARYGEAVVEFKAILAGNESVDRDEVTQKLSEALIQLKQYDEAKRYLTQLAGQTGSPEMASNALFWMGRLAIREGQESRLLEMDRQLTDRYPASSDRPRLAFMTGDFYEGRNRTGEAIKTYQRIISDWPSDPSAEDAVWRLGWIAYKSGRYSDTIQIFSEHLKQHPATSLGGQFGYWIGRSSEALDQTDSAIRAYQEVCRNFLRTFYCQQATKRLSRLGAPVVGGNEGNTPDAGSTGSDASAANESSPVRTIFDTDPGADTALTQDRHYAMERELMALQLTPEAVEELSYLSARYATNRTMALKLAGLLYEAQDYYHSSRLLRIYFPNVLEQGGDDVPKSFWEQAYPYRFLEWVKEQTPSDAMDPHLVAAVVREESAYDPKAVSRVGAVGLMQLMPYTGEWVANRVGLTPFNAELLMDGSTNVRLGSWYLQHLVEQFNGNIVLAVASYNAGPEAVGRWAGKGVRDPDEFIESIPYNETRYFTKRVLRSYNEYRRIDGAATAQRMSSLPVSP